MSLRITLVLVLALACGDDDLTRRDVGGGDGGASDAAGDVGLVDGDGDGFRSDVDCDDSNPDITTIATRPCEGACSTFVVQCNLGVWEECPSDDCPCEPGETRDLLCPMCAMQTQTCGADSTWSAPGACTGGGECSAESTEVGEACGRCGTMQRQCSATCAWSDFTCVEDPSMCNAWLLPPGATEWSGWRLTGGPADVQAAWGIEAPPSRVWVLSFGLHVFDPACLTGTGPATGCWLESGDRSRFLDENITEELHWGISIPRTFTGTSNQFLDASSSEFSHRFQRGVFTGGVGRVFREDVVPFTDPQAPPSIESVRAGFGRVGDTDDWVSAACSIAPPKDYVAYLGPTSVHVFSADGSCWVAATPYASFPPFALPGAPPLERIEGAAYDVSLGLLLLADPDP